MVISKVLSSYKRKVRLTKHHIGFANADEKFKQIMTEYVVPSSQKLITQTNEEKNNQILISDVVGRVIYDIMNHNNVEAFKIKIEDEISVEEEELVVPKSLCL